MLLVPQSVSMPDKTGALYGRLTPMNFTRGQFVRAASFSIERRATIPEDLMFNAFESVAFDFFPGLREDRETFSDLTGRQVHLAGSGPCLYVLCENADEAMALEASLTRAGHDARVERTTG